MARRSTIAALGLALVARSAAGGVRLELTGAARAATTLEVHARNAGDGAATGVTPEVTYQHHALGGDPATIAAGATHDWSIALPPSSGPGTFPAVVRVRYADGVGTVTTPLVVLVPIPTAPPAAARAALDVGAGPAFLNARVDVDNGDARPLAGRVAFVLPSVLHTEPESAPLQVQPGERRVLPAAIDSHGAQPGTAYPVWAVLEYDDDGIHYAVAAHADAVGMAMSRPLAPLAIGGIALAGALAAAVLASRAVRRRAAPV